MMSHAQTIPTGTELEGKYRIDGLLSDAGGMGEVYRATQTAIGRQVAVKVLRPEFSEDPQVAERFRQEARIAGSLGHPNICEVTDLGELPNGSAYLVMPLLQGCSLADLLKEKGRLSLMRVADIACQTLSALSAAHERGIVHRDLKPDNIFVTTLSDGRDFVKLLDFGISKMLHQDQSKGLTMTGTTLGTPQYMSPEQARGSKEIDALTDIYAMGAILYHAITGVRPFEGTSYNEILAKILMEPYRPPREIVSDITRNFENVIFKAMSRDSSERFQSAGEMSAALQRSMESGFADISVPLIRALDATVSTSAPSSETISPVAGRETGAAVSPASLKTPRDSVHTVDTAVRSSDVIRSRTAARRRTLMFGGVAAALAVGGIVAFLLLGRSVPDAQPVMVPVMPQGESEETTTEPTVPAAQYERAAPGTSPSVAAPASVEPVGASVAAPADETTEKVLSSELEGMTPAEDTEKAPPKKRRRPTTKKDSLRAVNSNAKAKTAPEKATEKSAVTPKPSKIRGRYGAELPDDY